MKSRVVHRPGSAKGSGSIMSRCVKRQMRARARSVCGAIPTGLPATAANVTADIALSSRTETGTPT